MKVEVFGGTVKLTTEQTSSGTWIGEYKVKLKARFGGYVTEDVAIKAGQEQLLNTIQAALKLLDEQRETEEFDPDAWDEDDE